MNNHISTTALVLLAVVPVVASQLLAATFNLLGEAKKDEREHQRWLLERRYENYTKMVEAATAYAIVHGNGPEYYQVMHVSSHTMPIASDDVADKINIYLDKTDFTVDKDTMTAEAYTALGVALSDMRLAMRVDLAQTRRRK